MNRVVVTGIGMVTPLAYKTNDTWQRLIEGKSGINKIMSFDTDDLNVKIAGQIPSPDEEFGFNPDNHLEKKDQRKVDDFIIYAIAAANPAIPSLETAASAPPANIISASPAFINLAASPIA